MTPTLLTLGLACASYSVPLDPTDGGDDEPATATTAQDTASTAPETGLDTATPSTDTPSEPDAAEVLSHELPSAMTCGESVATRVSMRNTGSATWTRDEGYKLGAVDDSDPFYRSDTRVWLPEGVEVPPGAAWTFDFTLEAPDGGGTWTTDWQMVHEAVRWFGEAVAVDVAVTCDEPEPSDEPPPLDLNDVSWLHTDVSGWAETGTLASVSFSSSEICLDYDKADTWPIYDYSGTDVVGNPWVFIYQDGQWYGATWEWLRPGQTCKNIHSVAGDHIKQSPFSEDSGWVPTSGDTYYFMVSGLARSSFRNVEERTNVVKATWP